MKQLTMIFTAVIFFATGYIVGIGKQDPRESDLVNIQESNFVIYSQQAGYKLTALRNIKAGKVDDAVGILEASLVVDENEMSNCEPQDSGCSAETKVALKEYKSKKASYEKDVSVNVK